MEAKVDVCTRCKKRYICKKCIRTGKIDNHEYAKEHARNYLQKGTKQYEHEYGKTNV